jgi:predicted amidohydrolase YtcJ
MEPDSIVHNAKIATNGAPSFVESVAIKDGKISAVGSSDEILRQRGAGDECDRLRWSYGHTRPE